MTERKREMSIARFARRLKRPHGICVKMTAVAILGLCFVFFWYFASSPSSSVSVQRESFDDIAEPVSSYAKKIHTTDESKANAVEKSKGGEKGKVEYDLKGKNEKMVNESVSVSVHKHESRKKREKTVPHRKKEKLEPVREKLNKKNEERPEQDGAESESEPEPEPESDSENGEIQKEDGEEGTATNGEQQESSNDVDGNGDGNELAESEDPELDEKIEEEAEKGKKRKKKGPVFDPKARYSWKLCNIRSKHNYMPCIDNEGLMGRLQGYRHRERSCPKTPPMCLVPLPRDGYDSPVPWPESKSKILYKNVAHPKLTVYIKKHDWLVESSQYVTFPQNQTVFKGGVQQYLESIEEMVPDVDWGKNVRVVLDIGCSDSSFVATLLDKDVLTLSLGMKDDLVDLAQVALERGFPTMVSPFAAQRLPFPSGVFDAIHCGACGIPWHSHGGRLLLEMNRVLRPNGFFILSNKHENIEDDEAMTSLTASICWNILAHKTDEASEVGVKIYQKPESNDIYELRRKKNPPLCKENENPDAAWYVPMKACLHAIPSAIEQHGTEWPEEWPKRLETYPDWLNNKEKAVADTSRWKAIVDKSYLTGLGIDWSKIRNVMDMKASYGGFAAALSRQNVWVMNVVPVHAPDTLPFIYERGLIGIYHDWCESFGTYPRSYDLLHADHLFSRLKNRCKQPVSIVVEMDRVVRPGGWVIVRDKVEILDPLEVILKSLHWEIRMTYAENKEGMLCAQKTSWRP